MAMALRTLWLDGPVAAQLRRVARERAAGPHRRWTDVAADVRDVLDAAAGASAGGHTAVGEGTRAGGTR
jgi:hypothetical protein